MKGDARFWLIVIGAGVGLLLLWQFVKRFPLSSIVIGILIAGYGVWKEAFRDFLLVNPPSFDSVKKEFARFQDPKTNQLDSTWHQYPILKHHGKVDARVGSLSPGDYFWVSSYEELTVWANAEKELADTKSIVFAQYRVTDEGRLFLGTSAVREDYLYDGRSENVFVKVWRRPRALTEEQKAELELWLFGGGLIFMFGIFGYFYKRAKRNEVEIVVPEIVKMLPEPRRERETMDALVKREYESRMQEIITFRNNGKGLAGYIGGRVKKFRLKNEYEDFMRDVQRITQDVGMMTEYNEAMVGFEESRIKLYEAQWNPELDKKIVRVKKQTKLVDAQANLEDARKRRDQARKDRENLQKKPEQPKVDLEQQRRAVCNGLFIQYWPLIRDIEIEGYEDMLKDSKLEPLYPYLTKRMDLKETLRSHIENDGVQPEQVKLELEALLNYVGSGGSADRKAYRDGQKEAAADRGGRRLVKDEIQLRIEESKKRAQSFREQEKRGEITHEEAEEYIARENEMLKRDIQRLEMSL